MYDLVARCRRFGRQSTWQVPTKASLSRLGPGSAPSSRGAVSCRRAPIDSEETIGGFSRLCLTSIDATAIDRKDTEENTTRFGRPGSGCATVVVAFPRCASSASVSAPPTGSLPVSRPAVVSEVTLPATSRGDLSRRCLGGCCWPIATPASGCGKRHGERRRAVVADELLWWTDRATPVGRREAAV